MNYYVHSSRSGELLAKLDLDEDRVEELSGQTAEGHFRAGDVDGITEAGINPEWGVYAIPWGGHR